MLSHGTPKIRVMAPCAFWVAILMLLVVACETDDDLNDPSINLEGILLQEGTGSPVGVRCDADYQCARPLRCVAAQCGVPAAVSGVAVEGTTQVVLGRRDGREWVVSVEVADDSFERRQGLMWRTSMAPDWGMLFVYESEADRAFWMRNTYYPGT